MSNLNKNYIYFPKSVVCELQNYSRYSVLWVSGIFGTWFMYIPIKYKIVLTKNKILVLVNKYYSLNKFYIKRYQKSVPAINKTIGLFVVGLKRLIIGAGIGFKKYLRVRGVGYKFNLQKTILKVNVGLSHTINKNLSQEFTVKFSRKFKMVRMRSRSLVALSTVLSNLRSQKKPDVYKGKGIRYKKEQINRKEGKKKKTF